MKTVGTWVLATMLVVAVSGCALVDVNVKPPGSGLKTPIPGGHQRQIVLIAPFTDARDIKDRCGVQKGSFGDETAKAVCVGDPAHWLADLLANELRASGFTVLRSPEGAKDSALKVDGVLMKVFVEPVVGFWATTVESDFAVKLVATSRTGLEAERKFFTKGEITSVIWPQGIFNDSVEDGVRSLLARMVNAVIELMNRYPELGLERADRARLAGQMESAR